MRAWITKGSIRLIADTDDETDLLRELPNRVFKAMEYICESQGHRKGKTEIYLTEVKNVSST